MFLPQKTIPVSQIEVKCTSICEFVYQCKLAITARVNLRFYLYIIGNFQEQNVGQVIFDKSISFQSHLQGLTDPILMVKRLINPEYLVSSLMFETHPLERPLKSQNGSQRCHYQQQQSICETIQTYDIQLDRVIYAIQCEDWIYCFAAETGSGDNRIISTSNYSEMQKVRVAPNYIKNIMVFQNLNFLFFSENYIIRIQEYRQIDYNTSLQSQVITYEMSAFISNQIIVGDIW
ncbi:unnamed protein product [Paramecium octaurelia]|uniref:Uncharacterized protein n=1 Tax=Paramecium octaurelia TaxID=43137 RepID=A0A8S1VA60_PAROT|nr:unnamed protein product [Paramecium octaurelia]